LNDRAWAEHLEAAHDPFAAQVDTEPEAAEPAWSEPAVEVVCPGETAPIAAAATVQIGPRVSEWADELLEQLLDVIARATQEQLEGAVSDATGGVSPSVAGSGWSRGLGLCPTVGTTRGGSVGTRRRARTMGLFGRRSERR